MEEPTKRIERVDKITDSPSTRAKRVWDLISGLDKELTDWDMLCFAVEYCGSLVPRYSWLEDVAKAISKRVYMAHYYFEEFESERYKENLSDNDDETGSKQV